MIEGWHTGRNAIIDFFYGMGKLKSNKPTAWRTVQRWIKSKTIILRHDAEGRPFIIESEIVKQKIKQSNALR
jgi:hypothetical protein